MFRLPVFHVPKKVCWCSEKTERVKAFVAMKELLLWQQILIPHSHQK